MSLIDLQRRLIRLSGSVLTRGAAVASFEAAHPTPRPREFDGLRVMVENPAGSTRSGVSRAGKAWSVKMKHDYGFLPRAKGADGEGLDVFLNATPCRCDGNHENAYIVHQNDPATGKYDEDKCLLGFSSAEEAKAAYLLNYDRPDFFRSMTIVPMPLFRQIVEAGGTEGVTMGKKARRAMSAAVFSAGESQGATPEVKDPEGVKVNREDEDDRKGKGGPHSEVEAVYGDSVACPPVDGVEAVTPPSLPTSPDPCEPTEPTLPGTERSPQRGGQLEASLPPAPDPTDEAEPPGASGSHEA